jgi:hypothetical protein
VVVPESFVVSHPDSSMVSVAEMVVGRLLVRSEQP